MPDIISCPACDKETYAEQEFCPHCNHQFVLERLDKEPTRSYEDLVLRPSKSKYLGLGTLIGGGGAATMVAGINTDDAVFAILGAAAIGLGLLAVWSAFMASLSLTPSGFSEKKFISAVTFPWSAVGPFQIVKMEESEITWFVGFEIIDGSLQVHKQKGGRGGVDRMFGTNYGMKVGDLKNLLNDWRDRFGN